MLPPLTPVTLTGQWMELQPLSLTHHDDLCAAVIPQELWRLPYTIVPSPETVGAYISEALAIQEKGGALPFAIIERASGKAVGTTRFANIRYQDHSVEIGWTWLGVPWQRTAINTEAKYHLFTYAFETLACLRVELKTDILNERSRRAIERIGATQEGVFRRHMIMPDGRVRDTVYFSVIDQEWPRVKAGLRSRLGLTDD